jgi:UDP-N-acetyl-D-mannosaminuronate dehydrogenase
MNVHIVNFAEEGFKLIGRKICLMKIAVMGFALRKNINNSLESPVFAITDELIQCGDDIRVFDSFVPSVETDSAMFFPDNNRLRENQPWLFTELINLVNPVDGKNLFWGETGKIYLRIGKGT